MNDTLPIVIIVSQPLCVLLPKIKSVSNKLEAQLNFQTLTASWYGDEEHVLNIHLYLLSGDEFTAQKNQHSAEVIQHYADDVFMVENKTKWLINSFISLTENELVLLTQHPKLLTTLLPSKLTKILNLIAKQQNLTPL